MKEHITLSCGNGGVENSEIIKIFLKHFDNAFKDEDAGLFSGNKDFVTSIDSFTIKPIFFPNGDIGKLSICGSCNDVAMMGAKPKYLSVSFIIEEGFLLSNLQKIAKSMSIEMQKANLTLISADTKVIERQNLNADSGIFVTTSVIGELQKQSLSAKNLQNDDVIIVSGEIGTHGACIYCLRENIKIENSLQSDCAMLWDLVDLLVKNHIEIHAMRDATRGGIASSLNEWANASNCEISIDESAIPINNEVRGVCEILGIDVFSLANEGVCVIAIPKDYARKALNLLKTHKLGKNASIIGSVRKDSANNDSVNKVILKTHLGIKRYLEYPQGEILPRIC